MLSDVYSESQAETQQQTQSTQQVSQGNNDGKDDHLWGYLQPCSTALTRIDFWKIQPSWQIGRNQNIEENQIVLQGFKVSNVHCVITWDGVCNETSSVLVHDLSSNGTFINGQKIGKGKTRILREGNELAFGTAIPQPQDGGVEDYRFFYRHLAGGPPKSGVHAKYDLGTELGKGTFGTVIKAVSRSTGQWYAVKMIPEAKQFGNSGDNSTSPSRLALFTREITIMERMRHPNICELKEVFIETNNDINLVLELVEGGDLLEYILAKNGISEPEAQHITYQICNALAYIHQKGVTHRDLKPENILLTKDVPPVVKIADFGLAKVVDSLTMLRTVCGTPNYLAPEVIHQEQALSGYDNVVDSWSVGVIVFSMLTNSSPFDEDETLPTRQRILSRQIHWDLLNEAQVSAHGIHFIRSLLEPDPLKRLTMAEALLHPWLQANAAANQQQTGGGSFNNSSIDTNDVSMVSSFPDDESSAVHVDIPSESSFGGRIPGSFPSSNANGKAGRSALQRRSFVLAQAAEAGDRPSTDQSWDIVSNVTGPSGGQPESGPSGWNGTAAGGAANYQGQKRVRSELSPLSDCMEEEDAEMHGSSPSGSSRKERTSDEEDGRKQNGGVGKSTRGKGKPYASNNHNMAESPTKRRTRAVRGVEAEEEALPRRSGRNQKQPRRA